MFCGDILLVTNNLVYLLPESLLGFWIVDKGIDDYSESGGRGVETSEEKQNGRRDDS